MRCFCGHLVVVSLVLGIASLTGCTIHHSKSTLWSDPNAVPPPDSVFVTSEDSGLSVLGLVTISEPDHYAVLLERARLRHRCRRINHVQLDFYTDHWLIVAFPISRATAICAPEASPKPSDPPDL